MLAGKQLFTLFTPTCLHTRGFQVTVLGGATEIGQTLGLLLRGQPNVSNLVIHDTRGYTPGVTMDLSHVPAKTSVIGYTGDNNLDKALQKSDIVIAVGGYLLTPGVPMKHWISNNTDFMKKVATAVARLQPQPFFAIATEPINCLVPMAAELMRNSGHCDAKKLFGITTVDAIRAQTLYASEFKLDPQSCAVPVVGGHSDQTCVPLLSQTNPKLQLSNKAVQEFTTKFCQCNERLIRAKGGWAPTLSVAYGVLAFTRSLLDALADKPAQVNAYVENNDFGTSFFSGLVEINKDGVQEMKRYTDLSQFECCLLERSIDQLRKDVLYGKQVLEMV